MIYIKYISYLQNHGRVRLSTVVRNPSFSYQMLQASFSPSFYHNMDGRCQQHAKTVDRLLAKLSLRQLASKLSDIMMRREQSARRFDT